MYAQLEGWAGREAHATAQRLNIYIGEFFNVGDGEKMAKTSENMEDTLLKLIDKLAGKESDIKLSFQDLTLDIGVFKAKLNGSIILDIVYVTEIHEK